MHFACVLHGSVSLGEYHCANCACFTWQCKPWEGITVFFVCFMWQCKPCGGTTAHFVCVLRGNVSLEGVPLCTLSMFYVAM